MIIALEGLDGAGKSTVVKLLNKHWPVSTVMRDPGCTPFGEKMREIMLDKSLAMTSLQLCLCFTAVHDALLAAAEKWEAEHPDGIVILDRCFLSNLAYRYADGGEDMYNFSRALISHIHGFSRIDHIFFLDCPEEIRKERLANTPNRGVDRFESQGSTFRQRVAEGYTKALSEKKGIYTIVDASGTPASVASAIIRKVGSLCQQ